MPIAAVFILTGPPSQHKRVVRMNRYLSPYLVCVAFLLLGACESYDFSVNENVVYSPAPLFSDFEAADNTLQKCLVDAVAGGKITQANQLKTLNCSQAGVTNLAGIETFTGISRLKLSSNSIRRTSSWRAGTTARRVGSGSDTRRACGGPRACCKTSILKPCRRSRRSTSGCCR